MKHPGSKDPGSDFDWLTELDCSEREQVDDWSKLSDAERSVIERLDTEIWGSLPCLVDPVTPSSQCKQELMSKLALPQVAHMPRPESARPQAPRWLLPLAAGLTFLAVGFAASMALTVRDQRDQLAALHNELAELSLAPAASTALAADFAAARENLGLVSSRGVEICALRPTIAVDGAKETPYGLLFLAEDHQHWYVRVGGLAKVPDGYYRVWFETEDGLVPAGNLAGEELELSSPTMPEGTRAVHVSLEREPDPATPSDEIVLFGDDMVRVL